MNLGEKKAFYFANSYMGHLAIPFVAFVAFVFTPGFVNGRED